MKERPILFSGPMVRAILDGRKTQTRRVVKPQPDDTHEGKPYWYVGGFRTSWIGRESKEPHWGNNWIKCPYGSVGTRLWVRETWNAYEVCRLGYGLDKPGEVYKKIPSDKPYNSHIVYACDSFVDGPFRPSIHMPRWASRITLEITGVRVERLNDISQPDIAAEGIDCHPSARQRTQYEYRNKFCELWQSINGPDSWAANPWVWAIEFKRVEK